MTQPSTRSNKKEVAIYGNYRNYYGYRVGRDLDEDPRLKVMRREWFEGKDCLDIGCNSGLITITVAKKFGCRNILGIDIDGDRIKDARWTLRKVVRTSVNSETPKSSDTKNDATESLIEEKRDSSGNSPISVEKDLPKVVYFQEGNFVQDWRPPPKTYYHAILCLSVSKWIHLNEGDEGLITLFHKAWMLLHPGGVFILEPQPWSSYYNNRTVSKEAAVNYKAIEIPPEDFQYVLLDKIGFRRVENLTCGLSAAKSGFDRPILAFWK